MQKNFKKKKPPLNKIKNKTNLYLQECKIKNMKNKLNNNNNNSYSNRNNKNSNNNNENERATFENEEFDK